MSSKSLRDAAAKAGYLTQFENGEESVSDGFKAGWDAAFQALRVEALVFQRYEELLFQVLDLPQIEDGHPRGIKALIREALK